MLRMLPDSRVPTTSFSAPSSRPVFGAVFLSIRSVRPRAISSMRYCTRIRSITVSERTWERSVMIMAAKAF